MTGFSQKLKDLLWPRRCELCGREADRPGRYVCSDCLMRLPFNPVQGICSKCGRPAEGFDRDFLCEDCRHSPPSFDRAAASLRFEDDTRRLVSAFKSRSAIHLAGDIADIMEGTIRSRFNVELIDAIVPVPSTIVHRLLRGYNQCGLIASELSRRLAKPSIRLLKRIGFPKRQAELREKERKENAAGSFAALASISSHLPDPQSSTLLVVDDVMTTGSTLGECAKVLKDCKVGTVWTAALAHTYRDA